jgi:hypothetical protein
LHHRNAVRILNQAFMSDTIQNKRSRASLERELQKSRHDSVIAMRKGDFRMVARLTNEVARIHRVIIDLDGQFHEQRQNV